MNNKESNPSPQFKPEFMKLSKIAGLHPYVKELESQYTGLAPFSSFNSENLPAQVIHSMLKLNPVIYRNLNGKKYCIGNIRLYQLAVNCLDPSENIQVSLSTVNRGIQAEISQLFWAEFLLVPLATDLGKKRHRWLHNLWIKFNQHFENTWSDKPLSKIKNKPEFARLINIDPRTLNDTR